MSEKLIPHIFRQEILDLSAYKVVDAHNLIKLDAMENPFSWPDPVIDEWLLAIRSCPFNRYPDPEARQLVTTLKQFNALSEHSGILLGNGSDELIQILLMALPSDAVIMAPEPSFVMYRQIARSLALDYQGIPLRAEQFDLDMPAMLAAIDQHRPAIIFLAYPNNPTGNLFAVAEIEQILHQTDGLVVIDEAYAPFTDASFIDRLEQHPNLLIMRTLSKLGLAALRLGFLVGNTALIEQLNKIRLPYNINSLTQITADFALKNGEFLRQQSQEICRQREWLTSQLNELEGIKALPSSANFILFKSTTQSADNIFQSLKQQGILIKNLSPQGGLLHNHLRVTIGTEAENTAFIEALAFALQTSD